MVLFLNNLKQGGYLDQIQMTLCNVGSRKLSREDDYGSQNWSYFAPNLTIYGFDADPEACEAANADFEARQADWNEFHLPYAIAKETGSATLYVTRQPMCSSLYPPNEELLKRYPRLPVLVGLDRTVEIETTTLDHFCQMEEVEEIDFLQIDVQGAELQVLEGAVQILSRNVLAVQLEVEFSPLYKNQPLFADLDAFMRRQGFTLFDLSKAYERRSLICSALHPGQLVWGEAIYLRDPLDPNTPEQFKTPDTIFKLACIADALDFTDYALELFETLTIEHDFNFADLIVESLANIPEVVQLGLETLPIVAKLRNRLSASTIALIEQCALEIQPTFAPPVQSFQNAHYLRHNQRRQEHLASLGLDLFDASVLEVGAGIGDHTSFFLDRGCQVVSTEGRPDNFDVLYQRYPGLEVRLLDLDNPEPDWQQDFDIVYCYGLLYHLHQPETAIEFMSKHCQRLLLLETVVSAGEGEAINLCSEPANSPTQSISGIGCRPTRAWVYQQLKQRFEYVYMPITQPNHEEFPLDWTADFSQAGLTRSVFIASRSPICNPLLLESIPMQQQRH